MAGKWTDSDKRRILETYTVISYTLKSYGTDNIRERLRGWEAILSAEYSADAVCRAMVEHAKRSSDIPTLADLIAIIKPPQRRVTYAEYQNALKQHAAEGYPAFGYYGGIIREYESGDERVKPATGGYVVLNGLETLAIEHNGDDHERV